MVIGSNMGTTLNGAANRGETNATTSTVIDEQAEKSTGEAPLAVIHHRMEVMRMTTIITAVDRGDAHVTTTVRRVEEESEHRPARILPARKKVAVAEADDG